MTYRNVFKRFEIKYLLDRKQKTELLRVMEDHMELDRYGRDTIRNVYYDTKSCLLIRRSLDRPVYKEKLRVRSYERVNEDDNVFVEIKKKYEDIVYKRRIAIPEHQATDWLIGAADKPFDSQIANEIDYLIDFYGDLSPTCFISYEREAYKERNGGSFRLTLDENILARCEELSLTAGVWGTRLIDSDQTLMELKTEGGLPLWMVRYLSANHVAKISFSKYGTAYKTMIFPQLNNKTIGGLKYA